MIPSPFVPPVRQALARVLAFLALLPLPAAWAAPKLTIDQPTYQFGKHPFGRDIEHVFRLRNAGDQELRISDIRKSCSVCTEAQISRETIPAGGAADLRVVYRPKPGQSGPLHAFLVIQSNDPALPVQNVFLVGEIAPRAEGPALTVDPAVDLGVVRNAEERGFDVRLRNDGATNLEVRGVLTSPGLEVLRSARVVLPGAAESLSVRLRGVRTDGALQEWVKVQTNDPANPTAMIRVEGRVQPEPSPPLTPATLAPAATSSAGVSIAPVTPPETQPGAVAPVLSRWAVRNSLGTAIQVRPLKADGTPTSTEPWQVGPGQEVQFRVTVRGAQAEQPLKLEVSIPVMTPTQPKGQ
jgi:hypothetical protein